MWYEMMIYEINENGRKVKVKKQIYTDFTLDDWGEIERKNRASDDYYLKKHHKALEEIGYIIADHIKDFKPEYKLEAIQVLQNIKNHAEMVLNDLGIFPEVEFTVKDDVENCYALVLRKTDWYEMLKNCDCLERMHFKKKNNLNIINDFSYVPISGKLTWDFSYYGDE